MSYITQSDLEKRLTAQELIQLTDYTETGEPDTSVVDQAIEDAESLVDSYVGRRVGLPLATVPNLVKTLALNFAVYFLFQARRSVTEDVRRQYESDIKLLQDIAAGRASLGDAADVAGGSSPAAQHDGQDRQFTRDTLRGF